MSIEWDNLKHNELFEVGVKNYGGKNAARLGPYASYDWFNDAKHLLFIMARYKFCAKMLQGYGRIMDIGCGDGTGMPILLQSVKEAVGIDIINNVIEYNNANNIYPERVEYRVHNFVDAPVQEKFDAAISMDVIEHLQPEMESGFLANVTKSLSQNAAFIVGTPNITAQQYAGLASKHEHINLKSHDTLKSSLQNYFNSVFMFSMNDEVLHTGFHPMSHYIIALAVGPKL
jgi:2-polyprenyl-3-methyl-5-hydroxy-6-metoxy-1,4-benzoquinol methylase